MKKFLKIFIIVSIFFLGYNVYALDLGKTEEVTFPNSYKNRARGSSDYVVFYSIRDAYVYDFESNSFKELCKTDSQINTMYVRNNTAYAWYGSNANSYVLSIDIATGTVKNKVNINRTGVLGGSFVVDLQGNYYFADNKIIDVYNNKGEKIKNIEATKKIGSLNDFTPNDEYLLVDLSITGFCYDEGALKLENKELKSGEVYSSTHRTPLWKFASDKKTAINQYGEIGVFDFNNLSDPYILKLSAVTGVKGYGIPIFYETSSMYYIPSSSGSLIGVSKNDYKKTEKIVVRENSYIAGLKYANNSLYVLSLDGSKYYITRVDLSKKITSKNVVFKNHTTLSHTKAQITSKYKEAKAKGNYTNSAYYKTAPVLTAPYNEGELKSELQTDTLNQLNYYRWLAGLNSVTINTARQSRNQKCAATMAINKELTHYPAKPEGMADDFYKEATAGCGAGYSTNEKYSGNVSYGQRIDYSVGGFVTDNYNVTPNVGHRNSLLDPTAKQVSFGYVSPYASISMYYDDTNPNSDEFFPWPAAGYFPVESISQTNDARWSVWLDSKYKRQKETKVTLTYNNKKYVIGTTYFDSHYNVLYYNVPEELLNEIVGTRSTIFDGTKVHVNISNLTGGDIDTYEIDYDINFFNAEVIDLDSIELGFFAVGSSMGTSIMPNKTVTIKKGTTYNLSTYLSPYNATVGQFTYKIADTTVATYDSTNKQIVPKKGGKTTLTVTDSKSKKSFTYNIKVYEKPNKVYFKDSKVTLAVGQKYTLSPIVEPSTATIDNPYYSSSDYNVAYISGGQVVANRVGTATITYKDTYHSDAPTATITVVVTDKKVDVAATGVKLNKTSLSLEKGKNTTLTATVTPSNATNKTVTWTSSNTKVATVTNGKVVGVAEGTATITVKTNNGKTATCKVTVTKPVFRVNYRTQVQDIGWQGYVSNGAMSGTSGKSKRLEAIKIKLENAPYSGNIEYRTHIQDIGWETSFKKNDTMSGTEHQSKRLEAIEIKLTGDISKYYDVYYRVHAEHFGWMGWAKNGEQAGSASYSYRLEGIEIVLVEKGKNPPTRTDTRTKKSFMKKQLIYTTHVQDYGWQKDVFDGDMSGTSHQSKRLEGIKIRLNKQDVTGNVEYMTHIQDIGWEKSYKKNGEMSGTSHQSKRLEAIKIRLTGNMAKKYDIYYRVHAQNFGWMGWAKNGAEAGTAHYSYRLEGIEIVLVAKGENPPERTDTKTAKAFIDKKAK